MATKRNTNTPPKSVPVFGSFYPLQTLWEGGGGASLFPSESSARWFLRVHRNALVEAEAIAIHTGRMLVDPFKCSTVAQRLAIDLAKTTGRIKESGE